MKVSREFNVWGWFWFGLGVLPFLLWWSFCCCFDLFLNKNEKTQNIVNVNFGGGLLLWFTLEMPLS